MKTLLVKHKHLLICLLGLLLLFAVTGCSKGKNSLLASLGFSAKTLGSAESLAMKGLDHFEHGKYYKALKSFETLLSSYPFSDYSLLAELKTADSNYYLKNYEEAVLQYLDFEEHHPTNEAIPYVMFQIGMCYYEQIDTIDRDVANAVNAINAFSKLLRAFPDSPYQDETETRIKAATNFLAYHEYFVASFYERTGAYEEAEARLEYLLKQYPESVVAPTAEMLLSDIRNGNPPGRNMFGWLPKKHPDWEKLTPQESESESESEE
ncbi:MAG: outer membrane protein assembly factor BamD [Deltaproteobacteria bacterium]|jgi:outer membrane protein assembly factor BamD|nr:outer membrane protein assembly factor BamD [Deltaproteobacteria bacterium]